VDAGLLVGKRPVPPPPPGTNWTRRVPHPVLTGHAASQVAKRPVPISERRFLATLDLVQELHAEVAQLHARAADALREPRGASVELHGSEEGGPASGSLDGPAAGRSDVAPHPPPLDSPGSVRTPGSADARGPAERSAARALGALAAGTLAAFERARAHFVAQVRVTVDSDTDTEALPPPLVRIGRAASLTRY